MNPVDDRHNFHWDRPPRAWGEGAFLGNGKLGAMGWFEQDGRVLRWRLGRGDVSCPTRRDVPVWSWPVRVPIGSLRLDLGAAATACDLRLDIGQAEFRGWVDAGGVRVRLVARAQADAPWLEFRARAEGRAASPPPRYLFSGERPQNPRLVKRGEECLDQTHPAPEHGSFEDGAWFHRQELRAEGRFHAEIVVGGRLLPPSDEGEGLALCIGYSEKPGLAFEDVRIALGRAAAVEPREARARHRRWWSAEHGLSSVRVPDARLQTFYERQLYKLASAARADTGAIDLMGPWFQETVWPGHWWNLNAQLTYWPCYTGNRLGVAESLWRHIFSKQSALAENADPAGRHEAAGLPTATGADLRGKVGDFDHGNLLWVCHNLWLHWRVTMEPGRLTRLLSLLRRAVGFYLNLLEESGDGLLHMPLSVSPEYPEKARDANYHLALLRWGCAALIEGHRRMGTEAAEAPEWADVLRRLAPFSSDENGYRIGADMPFARSHRHFSHLLQIYPLHLVNRDEHPETAPLVRRSVEHWQSMPEKLAGYSFTGAALMLAAWGDGDAALRSLNAFLDQRSPISRLTPNTFYTEFDHESPVIETPLSVCAVVHDLLLQSWGGVIRVFPATPSEWADAGFTDLRAEGAFLVSACRERGVLRRLSLTSLAGEPCIVEADWRRPRLSRPSALLKRDEAGRLHLRLEAGETLSIDNV